MLISFPAISANKKKTLSIQIGPQLLKKFMSLDLKKMVSNTIGLMNLFERMCEKSVVVHFLWIAGFISWILGCCYWVLEAEVLSLIFISGSIALGLVAIFDTFNHNLNESFDLRNGKLGFSVYVLPISISVLAMVATKSLAVGFTSNVLLLLLGYDLRTYNKNKED